MASATHPMQSVWTRDIVALAVAEGADERELWQAGELDADALGPEIDERAHLRVWEAIMRTIRIPGFPVRVASRRSIDDYALLGLACKTSRTVRDAVGNLVRYLSIWTSQYQCELRPHGDSADLVLHGPQGGLGRRCANESAVAQILKAIRDVCQVPAKPIRACFRHEAPADVSEHEAFFDSPVEFGAPFDGFELSNETLDTELALADDGLAHYLTGRLAELADRHGADSGVTQRARRAITELLVGGAPRLDDVARRIAMTPRTLQRQLSAADTTFARLVDDTRHALAVELLRHTDRPLAEVSFVLGFSEPSAFFRAFKRWTGTTPAAFRAG